MFITKLKYAITTNPRFWVLYWQPSATLPDVCLVFCCLLCCKLILQSATCNIFSNYRVKKHTFECCLSLSYLKRLGTIDNVNCDDFAVCRSCHTRALQASQKITRRELPKVAWDLMISTRVNVIHLVLSVDDSAALVSVLFAQQICFGGQGMASAVTTGWHLCQIKGDPSASKTLTLPALTFSKVEITAPLQKICSNSNTQSATVCLSGVWRSRSTRARTNARTRTHPNAY